MFKHLLVILYKKYCIIPKFCGEKFPALLQTKCSRGKCIFPYTLGIYLRYKSGKQNNVYNNESVSGRDVERDESGILKRVTVKVYRTISLCTKPKNNIHVNFANVSWVAFSIPSGSLSLVK
jgi:hypothetical protein